MTDRKAIVQARNVSMYPSDWRIVDAADRASAGVSATLRRIVREWAEHRRRTLVDTKTQYTTQEA